MKISGRLRLLSLVVAISAASLLTAFRAAPSAEEQAILIPVQATFDGMAARDTNAIKANFLPGGTLIAMRDGKPTQMTLEAFAERSGRPGTTAIQERIHDPLVRIDNDLAIVWAPFEYMTDGKVISCGTDMFNLVKSEGKWLIANLLYTGRKDCPVR